MPHVVNQRQPTASAQMQTAATVAGLTSQTAVRLPPPGMASTAAQSASASTQPSLMTSAVGNVAQTQPMTSVPMGVTMPMGVTTVPGAIQGTTAQAPMTSQMLAQFGDGNHAAMATAQQNVQAGALPRHLMTPTAAGGRMPVGAVTSSHVNMPGFHPGTAFFTSYTFSWFSFSCPS